MKYNVHFGGRAGENRSSDDLRNKFKALKYVTKTTGDPILSPDVQRAKVIQKAIEARTDVEELDSGDEKGDDLNDDGSNNN